MEKNTPCIIFFVCFCSIFSYMTAIYDNNPHVFLRLGSVIGRASSAGSGSYATIASIQKSPPSPSPYATSDACRVSYYASSQIMLISQVCHQHIFIYAFFATLNCCVNLLKFNFTSKWKHELTTPTLFYIYEIHL